MTNPSENNKTLYYDTELFEIKHVHIHLGNSQLFLWNIPCSYAENIEQIFILQGTGAMSIDNTVNKAASILSLTIIHNSHGEFAVNLSMLVLEKEKEINAKVCGIFSQYLWEETPEDNRWWFRIMCCPQGKLQYSKEMEEIRAMLKGCTHIRTSDSTSHAGFEWAKWDNYWETL